MAKRMNARKEVTKPRSRRGAASDEPDYADINRSDDDDDAGVQFDPDKFVTHVKNVRELKSKGAEIRGKIGAAVKNAEEDYGIHRGAASLWIKLDGMTEEARDAFLKAFDDMRTALGYATQTELFDKPAEAATFGGRSLS